MKDETCGKTLKDFVGLKSKSIISWKDNYEPKKAEGINKNVVNDELNYEDYKYVLFNRSYMRQDMNRIQSKDQNIGPYRTDKKYILEDGYCMLSHLHKII